MSYLMSAKWGRNATFFVYPNRKGVEKGAKRKVKLLSQLPSSMFDKDQGCYVIPIDDAPQELLLKVRDNKKPKK